MSRSGDPFGSDSCALMTSANFDRSLVSLLHWPGQASFYFPQFHSPALSPDVLQRSVAEISRQLQAEKQFNRHCFIVAH